MRKNRMMRLASTLLVLTMLTTCAISGTFAKYVTSDTSTDHARVAKFGVTVDVAVEETDKNDAFVNSYDGTVVGAATADEVLAPGTSGTLCTVEINGTPEVATKITADVDLELSGWTADGNYFPVIIKVGGNAVPYAINADAATIEQAVEAAVIKAIISGATPATNAAPATDSTGNEDFAANVSLAKDVTVAWEWPFETGADDAAKAENNKKDTVLGDAAAAATIDFTCTVTVEQRD